MRQVHEYEVVDHGFDSEQCFQGCGVANTGYEDVATGIGETIKEAFEDACDSLAQNDWDTSSIELGKLRIGRPMTVQGYLRSLGISKADREQTETHYYLSIRVN